MTVDSPELGPPDYTVPEDIETFSVCLNITNPPSDVPLEEVFNIMVTAADGTAGMQLIMSFHTQRKIGAGVSP